MRTHQPHVHIIIIWRGGCCVRLVLNIDRGLIVMEFILLHEKFLQFDWLRAVVFQLNLKYLQVKITNLLQVVV